MDNSARSLTVKFYAFSFFSEFILIYPFYTLLFDDAGLSAGQISILLVVWSATAFILEIPSGAVADKFNRKVVLCASLLFRLLGFVAWLVAQNFWGFVAGFVLWGAGSAFASGTLEALLYDELAKLKRTDLYAKVTGRMESLTIAAVLLASLAASAAASHGYSVLLVASMAALVLALIPILMLPTTKPIESTGETKYLAHLKQGVSEALFKPSILLIVIISSVIAGFAASDEFHNLLFREKGFTNSAIALWLAIIGVFGIVGSLLAHKFENIKIRLEPLLLLWAVLLYGAASFGGIAAAILIGLFMMLYYVVKVIFGARLQHAVSDKTRATTTSVAGFLSELFALLVFCTVGLAAGGDSYSLGFYILSAAIGVLAAGLWIFARFIPKKFDIKRLGL